jgi:hypothetical protein
MVIHFLTKLEEQFIFSTNGIAKWMSIVKKTNKRKIKNRRICGTKITPKCITNLNVSAKIM